MICISNVRKDLDIKATNVQISAAVSSNARVRLWQMLRVPQPSTRKLRRRCANVFEKRTGLMGNGTEPA